MAICTACKHYDNPLDDWGLPLFTRWSCFGRYRYGKPVIPECLQDSEIRQVIITGKCEFFNKELDFDHIGLPIVVK